MSSVKARLETGMRVAEEDQGTLIDLLRECETIYECITPTGEFVGDRHDLISLKDAIHNVLND